MLSQSLLCTLFAAVSAFALTTHPSVHFARHHHAIAARAAAPAPIVPAPPLVPVRRQNSRRCRPRSSSSSPTSTSTSTEASPTNSAPLGQQPTPSPRPTPTQAPAPSPTTTRASLPVGNLPSFMIGTQTGEGTYYDTGLGACGITSNNAQHIAAVSHLMFDNFPGFRGGDPNKNPICGRRVTARYRGNSVTVTLVDRCTGCAVTDLDFSPSAFNILSDPGAGRIDGVEWDWLD